MAAKKPVKKSKVALDAQQSIKEIRTLADLTPDAHNANRGTQRGGGLLETSLQRYGAGRSVLADRNGNIIAGNKTTEAAVSMGLSDDIIYVPSDGKKLVVVQRTDLDINDKEARELAIADNRIAEVNLDWNLDELNALVADGVDIAYMISDEELETMNDDINVEVSLGDAPETSGGISNDDARTTLAERFGCPPFTILDARQGYWLSRKRAWLALGLKSEKGRGDNLVYSQSAQGMRIYDLRNEMREQANGVDPDWESIIDEANKRGIYVAGGTSIFDPVLCEMIYRWFSVDGAKVLDPFAGGSVRGVVAAKLGRKYTGVELQADQVMENVEQGELLVSDNLPTWINGDSAAVVPGITGEFDLVFSCPPYFDLEVYSDDPKDISGMTYDEFLAAYRNIIAASCAKLKQDCFACFVVGDVRDKEGYYRNFVSATISAFEDAGMKLYNEAVLITPLGSLAMRSGGQFNVGRKLGKGHQNVLVFYKGDPKNIKDKFGECQFGEEIDALAEEEGAGGEGEGEGWTLDAEA